jgi:hypothetical protein
MHRWQVRFFILVFVVALSAILSGVALAVDTPRNAAEDVRQMLFEAQSALLDRDTATAQSAITDARRLYNDQLQATFALLPGLDARLQMAFDGALEAVEANNAAALAVNRGILWTGLLQGSTQMVFVALEKSDAAAAGDWLQVRECRCHAGDCAGAERQNRCV